MRLKDNNFLTTTQIMSPPQGYAFELGCEGQVQDFTHFNMVQNWATTSPQPAVPWYWHAVHCSSLLATCHKNVLGVKHDAHLTWMLYSYCFLWIRYDIIRRARDLFLKKSLWILIGLWFCYHRLQILQGMVLSQLFLFLFSRNTLHQWQRTRLCDSNEWSHNSVYQILLTLGEQLSVIIESDHGDYWETFTWALLLHFLYKSLLSQGIRQ